MRHKYTKSILKETREKPTKSPKIKPKHVNQPIHVNTLDLEKTTLGFFPKKERRSWGKGGEKEMEKNQSFIFFLFNQVASH
jgi:hypothetical protein